MQHTLQVVTSYKVQLSFNENGKDCPLGHDTSETFLKKG